MGNIHRLNFYYGMRSRGFSIGCQPAKGLIGRVSDEYQSAKGWNDYYDVIVYGRKLNNQELAEYQLNYLGKEEL